MRNSMFAITLVLLAVCSPALHADPTTYYVNESVGSDGWITGYIVTNGTMGVLNQTDLISDDLWLWPDVGAETRIIGTSQNMLLTGDDLTATNSDLLFNYSGTDKGVFSISSPTSHTCFTSHAGMCPDLPADAIGIFTNSANSDTYTAGWDGNAVIGKNVGCVDPASTPEPGSLFLLGTGLFGMAALAWRRMGA